MSEEIVIRNCAPTLAGLKTGSLFVCAFESYLQMAEELRETNRLLTPKGLRLVPLRRTGKRVLLYLYRPARLVRDLSGPAAQELLREAGYPALEVQGCLRELAKRLRASDDFPHEIGLFLSYPPEDVRGFMVHRGRKYKCAGCWKVYGDAEKALDTFASYHRCTANYCKRHAGGATMAQLAVRDR